MTFFNADNITILSHLGDEVARKIGNFYKIKEGIKRLPTQYLGADTEKDQTENGREICTTSSRSYITNAIENVEGLLIIEGKCEVLKSNARNPFTSNYRTEIVSRRS